MAFTTIQTDIPLFAALRALIPGRGTRDRLLLERWAKVLEEGLIDDAYDHSARRIDEAELVELHDALFLAHAYFENRDRMNAAVHATQDVRWSPLTDVVGSARVRVARRLYPRDPSSSQWNTQSTVEEEEG
jgi:hypothetical protein